MSKPAAAHTIATPTGRARATRAGASARDIALNRIAQFLLQKAPQRSHGAPSRQGLGRARGRARRRQYDGDGSASDDAENGEAKHQLE